MGPELVREPAQVAELVDALVSGTSAFTGVEVRVLSWAPRASPTAYIFSRPLAINPIISGGYLFVLVHCDPWRCTPIQRQQGHAEGHGKNAAERSRREAAQGQGSPQASTRHPRGWWRLALCRGDYGRASL